MNAEREAQENTAREAQRRTDQEARDQDREIKERLEREAREKDAADFLAVQEQKATHELADRGASTSVLEGKKGKKEKKKGKKGKIDPKTLEMDCGCTLCVRNSCA